MKKVKILFDKEQENVIRYKSRPRDTVSNGGTLNLEN